MEQAKDFFDESKDLHELLNAEGVACLSTTTSVSYTHLTLPTRLLV